MVQFDILKFRKFILISSCGLKKVTIFIAFNFMERSQKPPKQTNQYKSNE